MREEGVRQWMRRKGLAESTIRTQMSKMRKIDRFFGDIDRLIESGEIENVAKRLADSGNLPDGLGNEGERNHLQQSLRYYRKFAAGNGGDEGLVEFDRSALERLKKIFLKQHPDFVTFASCPSFAELEGDYKRSLVEEAQRLMREMIEASDKDIGAALVELLAGRAEAPSNLIDWRAQKVFDNVMRAHPGLLENEVGLLARAAEPQAGIVQFVEAIWPMMRGDLPSNPYAESRMYPTMLRALVDPQSVLPIRSTPTDNASGMLLGKPAFANAPLAADELRRTIDMSREMMRIFDEEWGWAPRDLWDVQGFIWETCQKVMRDDDMTDDELLARFDGDERFRNARTLWSDEQKRSFCSMARAAHEQGLDWYHTPTYPVRVGRKFTEKSGASGTLASIRLTRSEASLWFGNQSHKLGLEGEFEFAEQDAEAFDDVLQATSGKLEDWMPTQPKRPGLWPDNYAEETMDIIVADRTMQQPTNLILYGPPGTGKTFRTAAEAVRLCGAEVPDKREDIMERYNALSKDGRIRFITFHQNFSYEEFVEGLRPETGDRDTEDTGGTGFRLEPRPGIFREMCAVAEEARKHPSRDANSFDFSGRKFWKMSLGRIGQQDSVYDSAMEEGHVALGYGSDVDWSADRFSTLDAIRQEWESEPREDDRPSNYRQLHPFRNEMKVGDIVVVPASNKTFRAIGEVVGNYYFADEGEPTYYHRRKVRWLAVPEEPLPLDTIIDGDFMMRSFYAIAGKRINKEALARLIGSSEEKPENIGGEVQQFVLVIDEINRANISKVFGELITLIEPDKRLGMANALKVRLPYSKREFGVPANLHIIGTMNTADRSVMQIDTALRRRFRFEEMEPDSSLLRIVDGINLGRVLDAINARIEYLLDRDHAVGHAFFMGDGGKDRAAIDDTMRFKIIPLLQEYFFDDWRNIAAVLGPGFVSGKTLPVPPGIEDRGDGRARWTIRWQENGNAGFPTNAYDLLLKGSQAEVDRPENGEIEAIGGYPEEA